MFQEPLSLLASVYSEGRANWTTPAYVATNANFPQLFECAKMTITPKISIDNGDLVVHGKTVLKGVPDNIMLTPGSGAGLVSVQGISLQVEEESSLTIESFEAGSNLK
ncbi:hypothetical protein ACET3Z_001109 [Daucus carota]